MRRLPLALAAVLLVGATAYQWTRPDQPLSGPRPAFAAGSCGLAQPAFCDPLNQPTANGPDVRSGDLNGVVWGVSRGTSSDNPTQGDYQSWAGATATVCGQTSTFGSPHDIRICNGAMFETVNDGGAFTTLGMYPRQPFDIAGRTGTVAFDLSADGLCGHCAWPAFEYTDQPVPAPNNISSGPRNGFGFTFNSVGTCASESQEGVGNMWVTSNFTSTFTPLNNIACVTSGHAGGPLNHFEVRMSVSHVEVWGSDAGSTTLKQLATSNLTMPLTRGLVWMEDQHYNAEKVSSQGTHTFEWANFGFDGPILPRDLGFDVRDGGTPDASGSRSLGYKCQPDCHITIPNLTAAGLTAAKGALLEFTWAPSRADTINYSFNGHATHSFPWPYPDAGGLHTIAIPVIVSELQAGSNALAIDASGDLFDMANIDIILVGAGGIVQPGGGTVSVSTPVPAATSVPPASTPVPPTATPVPPTPGSQTSKPVVFEQTNNAVPQSPQQVVQVRFSGAQTAGNTNIIAVGWNDATSSIAGVTDSAGNTYRVAVPTARGQKLSQAILYASNIRAAAGGANVVTVSFNVAVPFADVRILEYAGLNTTNPFDSGSSASGGSGTANSGTLTTHFANSIVIAAGMTNGSFSGAGSGYTARVLTNPDGDIVEDSAASTVGSYSATSPVNDVWVMQAAAFH